MNRATRARLKTGISDETVKAARSYLSAFSGKPYTVEHSDGPITVQFVDPSDLRLLRDQFPDLIAEVTPHSVE